MLSKLFEQGRLLLVVRLQASLVPVSRVAADAQIVRGGVVPLLLQVVDQLRQAVVEVAWRDLRLKFGTRPFTEIGEQAENRKDRDAPSEERMPPPVNRALNVRLGVMHVVFLVEGVVALSRDHIKAHAGVDSHVVFRRERRVGLVEAPESREAACSTQGEHL